MDRRGFFAGVGAFFTAVFTPVSPPNLAGVLLTRKLTSAKLMGCSEFIPLSEQEFSEAIKLPLYNPEFRRGVIGPFPYEDGVTDMAIPGLASFAEFVPDDPFQTFIVDTSLKVESIRFTTEGFKESVSVGEYKDSSYVVDEVA